MLTDDTEKFKAKSQKPPFVSINKISKDSDDGDDDHSGDSDDGVEDDHKINPNKSLNLSHLNPPPSPSTRQEFHAPPGSGSRVPRPYRFPDMQMNSQQPQVNTRWHFPFTGSVPEGEAGDGGEAQGARAQAGDTLRRDRYFIRW